MELLTTLMLTRTTDTILKQILITVGTKISKLSSNKYMFNINKELCNKALQNSSFNNKLSYLNLTNKTRMDKITCKHRNGKI